MYISRLNKNISYFSLFSHTQIISLKGGNTLLSHFYFLLPTQLSLGCLLLSKRLTFGCSLFFLVWLPLSLLLRTLFVSFRRRQPLTLSFLVFLSNENPFYSLLVSRSIFPLLKRRTLRPKPKPKLSNSLYLCLFIKLFFYFLLN